MHPPAWYPWHCTPSIDYEVDTAGSGSALVRPAAIPSSRPVNPHIVVARLGVKPPSMKGYSALLVYSDAERRALKLIRDMLVVSRTRPPLPYLPVVPHEQRLPPAERALSRHTLRAVRHFLAEHGALDLTLTELCAGPDVGTPIHSSSQPALGQRRRGTNRGSGASPLRPDRACSHHALP